MIVTGALTSANGIASLLEPGIRTLTGKGLRRRPSEYDSYLFVSSSRKAKETNLELAGLPIAVERAENEPIATFDPAVGNAKAHPMRSFAIGFEYSWESVDDDLYDWVPSIARQLGESMAEAKELDCAKILNRGFPTGGNVTTYNGETLFNTSHPAVPGTAGPNQNNVVTGDIGIGTLQTVFTDMENRVDSQGKRMRVRPVNLFYAPSYDFLVREIFQSEKRPFSANNEINSMMGRLQPKMLHYLDVADTWIVKGDLGEEYDLRFYNRTPPSMRSFDDERTRSSVFTVAARWGTGADAWQNVHGGKLVP